MTKREVVRLAVTGRQPPYVPWSFGFTHEARATLRRHLGTDAQVEEYLESHLLWLGDGSGSGFVDIGNDRVRDYFGVVWDRSVDKDIGVIEGQVLPEPTLANYVFPSPDNRALFSAIPGAIARQPDLFRVFPIGFSLYERAWTLRGMENLMMDFVENSEFVHELFTTITDWNIAQARIALTFDIDGVYFGDDWGSQHGLQMGPGLWREFIKPQLQRMYKVVRDAGKLVFIHSCGDVDELFAELAEIGVNCFNPFQPEVMDVWSLLPQYRGRLAFHGGLSTQRTLPYGTVEQVRAESRRLLDLGRQGSYIFAPAHAVEGDVPLANMLAFIDTAKAQPRG
jgi:uroporphyrinogen decarboxylase